MINEERDPVREFLESYWEARREAERLDQRVEELTCQCESVTAKYDCMPRGGGGSATNVWDALIEARSRAEATLIEYLTREKEVEDFISSLDNKCHRQVLRYRYLAEMKWEEIGERMNYTPRHVWQFLHPAALRTARQKWEEMDNLKNSENSC